MAEDLKPRTVQQLKAENELLKIKLAEQGAEISSIGSSEELPLEVENAFLSNVLAFEEKYKERKIIKVYDKIGRPTHFLPAKVIPDDQIEKAWKELKDYLEENDIILDVCSPNVSVRELYRFTIEELFEKEISDIDMPGWMTNFIYDEFYPDPVYDNTRAAMEDCIRLILQKDPLEWTHRFGEKGLRLNGHSLLTIDELISLVNRHKLAYDDIEVDEITSTQCTIDSKETLVSGSYKLTGTINRAKHVVQGGWKVIFLLDAEFDYWRIAEVDIEGIEF